MRKIFSLIFILVLLTGCSMSKTNRLSNKEVESATMPNKLNDNIPPKSDFINIGSLPESDGVQSTDNIAKILFFEFDDMQVIEMFAIDLANKGLYLNPQRGTEGYEDYDYEMTENDVDEMLSLIKDIPLNDWQGYQDDSLKGSGVYSWYLYIEYQDRTIKKFIGQGKSSEKIKLQPKGYRVFLEQLAEFINSKKEE